MAAAATVALHERGQTAPQVEDDAAKADGDRGVRGSDGVGHGHVVQWAPSSLLSTVLPSSDKRG